MYVTKKCKLKNLSNKEFAFLLHLSWLSKNVYNRANYLIRQYFFETGQYLKMPDVWRSINDNEEYHLLGTDPGNQVLQILDRSYRSFFSQLRLKQQGKFSEKVNIPGYIERWGHFTLSFPIRKGRSGERFLIHVHKSLRNQFGFNTFSIKRPHDLIGKTVKEVRIIYDGHCFYVNWVYEVDPISHDLDPDRILAIDPGVSNFATIVVNDSSRPIILDGREMKSINRWANMTSAKKVPKSRNKARLWDKRNRRINEFLNQYVNFVLQLCLEKKVSKVIFGTGFLADTNMGDQNNQNFHFLPYGRFCDKLKGKLSLHGIELSLQEESYTSKCDHLSGEEMCHHEEYAGKRIHRGLFRSSTETLLNADVNGALGILLKGTRNAQSLIEPANRGCLTQPRRIRLEDIRTNSSRRLITSLL